jgi:membrane-associated phospholipid phosphatase
MTLLAAYASGLIQIFVSVIYFSHAGQSERNKELWWASNISLTLTAFFSGIFPALGAFHYYNTELTYAQHLPDLLALRNGSVTTFMLGEMQGIISMPSYHTIMAIISIYTFRGIGVWFPFICLLNILMLISIPTHGGHYLVDMIAGAVVAGAAIYFVRYFKRVS